ncbi:MAG: hypothetical protein ABR861_07230 [Terriglobales bacterium]|jgi:hypothetical protein
MATQRLKAKVGEHEFDAEGPVDVVQRQYEAWKALIASTSKQSHVTTEQQQNQVAPLKPADNPETIAMQKILKVDGRIVSLTVKPESEGIAALLVLLGHKLSKNSDTVTASELRVGMEHSGYRFARVDRLMQPLCDEGLVIKIGTKKATRYRLINPGLARAMAEAEKAIGTVS